MQKRKYPQKTPSKNSIAILFSQKKRGFCTQQLHSAQTLEVNPYDTVVKTQKNREPMENMKNLGSKQTNIKRNKSRSGLARSSRSSWTDTKNPIDARVLETTAPFTANHRQQAPGSLMQASETEPRN